MDPLTPSLIELNSHRKLSDEEALSGERAPELLRGRYGMSSDLYGVGMSALSAMTGMSVARVDERLQSERLFAHDLSAPDPVIAFLKQLTAFRASARFQSAREALLSLAQLPSLEPLEPQLKRERQDAQVEYPSERASEGDRDLESARLELGSDEVNQVVTEPTEQTHDLSRSAATSSFYVDARPLGSTAAELLGVEGGEAIEGEIITGGPLQAAWAKLRESRPLMITLALLVICAIGWLSTALRMSDPRPPLSSASNSGTRSERADQVEQSQKPISERKARTRELVNRSQRSDRRRISSERDPQTGAPLALYLGGEVHGHSQPQWVRFNAGSVTIGSPEGEGEQSEQPLHQATVRAFEVSQTEVTVLQYAQCVTAGICSTERLNVASWGDSKLCNWGRINRANHPLNCVSWFQAKRYAEWVGGRLLSEVEWSYAAQGGSARRQLYPWGGEPASCERSVITDFVKGHGCGSGHTAPVCSRPLGHSPQGLCDMVGNVWEWVMDEWHPHYLGAPQDSAPWLDVARNDWDDVRRVYRGGGAFDERGFPRIARRGSWPPSTRLVNMGFRVARAVESVSPALESPETPETPLRSPADQPPL